MRASLEAERQKRGWTVQEAAKRYKISPGTWYKYAAGTRTPKLSKMREIASDMGKTIEDLFLCQ
jgi:transcriptional regulator with XRE-family HTH domain